MIESCCFLGSSSRGNSFFVKTSETAFLIDAGLTGKTIISQLNEVGVSINEIEAVFITHEHLDHVQGLRGLSNFPHIKFFANFETASAIDKKYKKKLNWNFFSTGRLFQFADVNVLPFFIPHDAVSPVGYFFSSDTPGKSLCWMTDLGYIPEKVMPYAQNADILVLESNYDDYLLDQDEKKPIFIKNRIRGTSGHLSNNLSYQLVAGASNPKWKKIFLAHLSRNCNDIERIQSLYGEEILKKYDVTIVDPFKLGKNRYFC